MRVYRKNRTQHAALFLVNGIAGLYFIVGDTFDKLWLEKISTSEVIFIPQNKPLHSGSGPLVRHSKDTVIIPAVIKENERVEKWPNGKGETHYYDSGGHHYSTPRPYY